MNFPRSRFLRILAALLVVLAVCPSLSTRVDAQGNWLSKLDPLLQDQLSPGARSRVVLRVTNAAALSPVLWLVQLLGGHVIRQLPIIDGAAVDVPNWSLPVIAGSSLVTRLSLDRLIVGANQRTGATVGATAVRQQLGYDGTGVGVAVIDSGVAPSHDDLTNLTDDGQRVDRFVDFTDGHQTAYDPYGHGTHVAGSSARRRATPRRAPRSSRPAGRLSCGEHMGTFG